MKVIIVGCGRVGSTLAVRMSAEGHDIAIIDKREEAFQRFIPTAFAGTKLRGSGFDREILEQAGITEADAFVSVTNGDNSNVVSARVAREFFKVPRVIARIYDPRRADIYRRLGIETVASVTWAVGRIRTLLDRSPYEEEAAYGNGEVLIVRTDLPYALAGRKVADVQVPGEIHVVSVTRQGRAFVPGEGSILTEDDILHIAVSRDALGLLDRLLGRA